MDLHLGRNWLQVSGVRSASQIMGYNVIFSADEDWRVTLFTSASHGHEKHEVDLSPGRVPAILKMFRSGDVRSIPQPGECQWGGFLNLCFSSSEKHDEFHNLIGPSYHERMELPTGETITCSDGTISMMGPFGCKVGEELALHLRDKYGVPISTSRIDQELLRLREHVATLEARLESFDKEGNELEG